MKEGASTDGRVLLNLHFSRRNELKFQGTLLALWQSESQSRAEQPYRSPWPI